MQPGRIEEMEVSEKEDVDAKPGERIRGWLKGDTQMHLNSIRLGLVNFFPTGAVLRQKVICARRKPKPGAVHSTADWLLGEPS